MLAATEPPTSIDALTSVLIAKCAFVAEKEVEEARPLDNIAAEMVDVVYAKFMAARLEDWSPGHRHGSSVQLVWTLLLETSSVRENNMDSRVRTRLYEKIEKLMKARVTDRRYSVTTWGGRIAISFDPQ